jgi:outer membrane protein W
MLNVSRRSCVQSLLFCLFLTAAGPTAKAQTTSQPETALDRQLARIDLAVTASVVLNRESNGIALVPTNPGSGTGTVPTLVNLRPSNTVGPLVTISYTAKPLVGFEFNYGFARYSDNFNPFGASLVPGAVGVQQNTAEYTFGYVAHFRKRFNLITPFAGAGLGTLDFRPTPGGGEGLKPQARATYYYTIGGDAMLSDHFGVRAQFREQFFKAPDFETNYLRIEQHTTNFQPGFGFFLRF